MSSCRLPFLRSVSEIRGSLPLHVPILPEGESFQVLDHHALHALDCCVVRGVDAQREALGRGIEGVAARLVERNGAVLRREFDRELMAPVLAELLEIAARRCSRNGCLETRALNGSQMNATRI